MKYFTARMLFLYLLSGFPMDIQAFDFQSDGIYYTILSESEMTVEVSQNEDKKYSGDIVIPETVTKYGNTYTVTTIGNWAFLRCDKLTSVFIPKTVVCMGEEPFVITENLQSIIVDDDNPNFKSDNGALLSKNGNDFIVYPSGKGANSYVIPEGVKTICSRAFDCSSNIVTLFMSNSVKRIEEQAFNNCKRLETIFLSESLEYIGHMAFWFLPLSTIHFPNKLKYIDHDAFCVCNSLKTVYIPASVEFIGVDAFGSQSLESIDVDPNNPYYTSIDGVLYTKDITELLRCPENIQDKEWFDIPNTVKTIGECAFNGNNNLTRLTIPASVTTIGTAAFAGCNNIIRVSCYPSTPPSTPPSLIYENETDPWVSSNRSNATLYVPKGSKETYLNYLRSDRYGSNYPWAEFKEIIEMEESSINYIYKDCMEIDSYYNTSGYKKEKLSKGFNIIKTKDGSVKKIITKLK